MDQPIVVTPEEMVKALFSCAGKAQTHTMKATLVLAPFVVFMTTTTNWVSLAGSAT